MQTCWKTGSRERAYVYAVSSAGAAYAVTRACSRGEITECGCDGKIRQRSAKGFEWGGCSEVYNVESILRTTYIHSRLRAIMSYGYYIFYMKRISLSVRNSAKNLSTLEKTTSKLRVS